MCKDDIGRMNRMIEQSMAASYLCVAIHEDLNNSAPSAEMMSRIMPI